ncbi:MAG: helix-turn-helix transcriptional regulator [Planctomycetota bacterium]
MTGKSKRQFGQTLRETRVEKGFSLRKFAGVVGVSPTYLSQVEQSNADPPTAERVRKMAEILGANVDEWTALAGRVQEDLPGIIQSRPDTIPELLRTTKGLTPMQMRELLERAKKMKNKEE